MKYTKSFIFIIAIGIFAISCGNKDTNHIISVKKASAEKFIDAFEKFENNFMLRNDIFDNGSAKAEFFITDYDLQGDKTKDISQTTEIIDTLIKNKIGITGRFVNDKKAQAFKFSYALNNILKNEEKTDVINIVMGQKNIAAASPSVFNKAFFIPAQDLGKALTLIAPKEIPANLNIDLTYKTLKAFTSIRPNKASQKRYDKARDILYKNAAITKNGDTYSIVFNNDDVIKFIPALLDAVKNDNRIKGIWIIYEKLLQKEFKEIEEKFNTEIKDKIQELTFTEELTIKDNLVAKDRYTVGSEGKEIVTCGFGIKNYENPIDDMVYTLNITDPKAVDTDADLGIISCVLAFKGSVTDTIADIDYSVSVMNNLDTSPTPAFDMHCSFYADTTKQNDNFKIGIGMNIIPLRADSITDSVEVSMQALGSVAKTPDMITYKIDTIGAETETIGTKMGDLKKENHTFKLGTDASFILSKNILEDISMPTETVKVLETKVSEWQAIKEEITANLAALSTLVNF